MTDEVKLRLLLELRKQDAVAKLRKNQEGAENDYWVGRLYQCDEVIAFLDGKIEVNVTTTVRYK